MNVVDALLDSWDRQCRIVTAVASLVDESNRHATPSVGRWPLDTQLAHIHNVRNFWLSDVAPATGAAIESSYLDGWETPISDLAKIKELLTISGAAVRAAVASSLQNGIAKVGSYDNPVLFLQHMIWHEGWHVGQIVLGLRNVGQEPPDEWEETHIWSEWRTEQL